MSLYLQYVGITCNKLLSFLAYIHTTYSCNPISQHIIIRDLSTFWFIWLETYYKWFSNKKQIVLNWDLRRNSSNSFCTVINIYFPFLSGPILCGCWCVWIDNGTCIQVFILHLRRKCNFVWFSVKEETLTCL